VSPLRKLRNVLHRPHPYPGRLIAVEGIDGSGKSTQLLLLERWLIAQGYRVHFTEWNSSLLVRRSMKRGKKKDLLTPTTFSLLHAVDFADRLTYQIVPPLKAGMIVLADRYVYTAFARDVARGVDLNWVRALYRFAPVPTLAIYFRIPLETALYRILSGRPKLKWYEAGMDLGLHADITESYKLFQSSIQTEYERIVAEYGLSVMDATKAVEVQQRLLRRLVTPYLEAKPASPAQLGVVARGGGKL
jgi:dTMP kinase